MRPENRPTLARIPSWQEPVEIDIDDADLPDELVEPALRSRAAGHPRGCCREEQVHGLKSSVRSFAVPPGRGEGLSRNANILANEALRIRSICHFGLWGLPGLMVGPSCRVPLLNSWQKVRF